MTKIGKVYREKITKKLQDGVEKESSAFVVNFRNVSSAEICTLRKALQQKKAKVYMSRNSLARVGLKSSVLAPITDGLDGQTLFIWTSADPVDVAKILVTEQIEIARALGLRKLEAELNGERKVAIRALQDIGFQQLMHQEDYVLDMKAVTHDYLLMGMDLKVDEEYAGVGE